MKQQKKLEKRRQARVDAFTRFMAGRSGDSCGKRDLRKSGGGYRKPGSMSKKGR